MDLVIGDRSKMKNQKKKKSFNAYAEEINAENRKAEEEDGQTSDTSDDSTVSSEEETM